MLIHKLKLTALTLLFLGAVATGAGYLTHCPGDEGRARKPPAARDPSRGEAG